MIEDDVLLRQIHRAAEVLARWATGAPSAEQAEAELDALARELFGLDLGTLRRIPARMLPALLPQSAPGGVGRWILAARILAEAPTPVSQAGARAAHAQALVDAALRSGLPVDPAQLADTEAAIRALRDQAP